MRRRTGRRDGEEEGEGSCGCGCGGDGGDGRVGWEGVYGECKNQARVVIGRCGTHWLF